MCRSIRTLLIVAAIAVPGGVGAQMAADNAAGVMRSGIILRAGDQLQVAVWPNAELGGSFVVEETGLVYLPFLGAVSAGGVSLDELRVRLREGYGRAMQNPVVTVSVEFHVGVLGAVVRPGVYTANTSTTLIGVIATAGGFTNLADQEKVRIVRGGEVIEVDAFRMLDTGQDLNELTLQSGDQIVVREKGGSLNWRALLSLVQTAATVGLMVERLAR